MFRFKDRVQAGQHLATKLGQYANDPDVIVLGLPRGGVVVAYEVAQKLGLPLDIFLVRKLGVPGYEELAMGAIASGGIRVMNDDVLRMVNISQSAIEAAVKKEGQELERREKAYRGNRPRLDVRDKKLILVDDGLATGATMRAAVAALRKQRPRQIIIAVPTASPDTCEDFRAEVDDIICAMTPMPFHAVGEWYEDFPQNTDEEVQHLLRASSNTATNRGDRL
jgi:putative phosphoribosyl transferase